MFRRFVALISLLGLTAGSPVFAATTPVASAAPAASAQAGNPADQIQATVTRVEKAWTEKGVEQMVFDAQGDDGKVYRVDTSQGYADGVRWDVNAGTRVVLEVDRNPDGTSTVFLADVVRTGGVAWIFLIFVLVALAVGLWRGAGALFGFGVTVAVLFLFVFPRIIGGGNPILYTLLGAVVMLGVNMHVAHGFTRSTLAAYLGTLAGLGAALAAAAAFVKLASLTGLATDDANYLFWRIGGKAYPSGILMAAILLGAAGVLDHVTSSASISSRTFSGKDRRGGPATVQVPFTAFTSRSGMLPTPIGPSRTGRCSRMAASVVDHTRGRSEGAHTMRAPSQPTTEAEHAS